MDRREYERIRINATGHFIIQKNESGKREFAVRVEDISEVGIKAVVDDARYFELVQAVELGTRISFQAVEEYRLYFEERTDVFQGEIEVLRKEKKDGGYVLGCRLVRKNDELEEFIDNRRVAIFLERGYLG